MAVNQKTSAIPGKTQYDQLLAQTRQQPPAPFWAVYLTRLGQTGVVTGLSKEEVRQQLKTILSKRVFLCSWHRPVSNEELRQALADQRIWRSMMSFSRAYPGLTEDERQYCCVRALYRCLQDHDASFGQKFTTSLHRHVKWECCRELESRGKHLSSFDPHTLDRPAPVNVQQQYREELNEWLALLDAATADLLRQHYLEGKSLAVLAQEAGVSRERIRQQLRQGRQQLRQRLQGQEPARDDGVSVTGEDSCQICLGV